MNFSIKKLIPSFLINIYHFLWAFYGALINGFPSKKIKVIGVTGTNGKSTTINLIVKILKEAGYKTAELSSIKFKIGKNEKINTLRMTMPGKGIIQKFLKDAVNQACDFAIIEVTSEGIKQYRDKFINFDTAVFTNLSTEHIEAHKGFENYKKAKAKFFKKAKNIHIINLDDEYADYFLKFPAKKKYGYKIYREQSLPNSNLNTKSVKYVGYPISYIGGGNIEILPSGIKFSIRNEEFNLKLLGKFNIYNALAAICVGLSQGIDLKVCKNGLEKAKTVPGRMEVVITEPFNVFIDYAFTPNALEQVYKTIRSGWLNIPSPEGGTKKKLICVLGACGGGRDKWKRPVLGKLAEKYCDKVIITNEDPYDENPNQILLDIKSGISNDKIQMTNLILDRRQAIKNALKSAQSGDVVVITGKGSEPSICLANGKKIPWKDKKVVLEEFSKLNHDF
ncbi:MAG: UDP-N-acetylmuramyl-tripeptide synthetase [Candidatus Pacebacteria bacterium]|nr:UDP-N-acetylmuramyl-tripeptide synthetase [Candidatus Paceibacterota bacterium]